MTERPILFSGAMVRAILEGRKTQTRRMVKDKGLSSQGLPDGYVASLRQKYMVCPYGQIGDRLWVRESFCLEGSLEYSLSESRHPRDGRPVKESHDFGGEGGSSGWLVPWYRATDGEPNIVPEGLEDSSDDRTRWKPSIHMPRWASRILLEITEVRVQRLQEISGNDAEAEGISFNPDLCSPEAYDPRDQFKKLWNSINYLREGASWTANPWVWALTFRRIKP